MQRSSNTTSRNIIIGSVIIILLVSVLYYLKRVEVSHLKKNIDSLQSQQHDHDDELNGKLTDYLQKLEDMTHQLGDINSRLQECEDNKANAMTEVQKCKGVHTECTSGKEKLETDMAALRKELETAQARQTSVQSQLSSNLESAQNAKQALSSAERELEQCDDEREKCNNAKSGLSTQLQDCKQKLTQCTSSARMSGSFRSFQNSLQGRQVGRENPSHHKDGPSRQLPPPAGGGQEKPVRPVHPLDIQDPISVKAVSHPPSDVDPDPLNASNEEDDKAGGAGIDDALAALEQAEGGGAKDDHPAPEGALKEAVVEPQEKEAKAEKDQAQEELEELENKAKADPVL